MSDETGETKACPWCGETILAVAKKCKHCGEFLDKEELVEPEPISMSNPAPGTPAAAGGLRGMFQLPPPPDSPTGRPGERPTLSQVGKMTNQGILTCPNCGSTQFTAKRSMIGKVIVGLLAAKSEVQCVACGTIFRRG